VALKTARAITAFLVVACGAQALVARPAIELLVPDKWMPAALLVTIASLGLVLQGLWITGTAWMNACGRYKLLNAKRSCRPAAQTNCGAPSKATPAKTQSSCVNSPLPKAGLAKAKLAIVRDIKNVNISETQCA